ncbi:DUF2202 domain-containing protein [Flavobacterium sp. NRK F10]|uniref:DUF2202 domain-containing protein n=1 Tax=Flavobacterium sp. NRK F10 TaxID=2954931 RepID=UPI002091803F|nr:DUF2202 domain-containing protein [Flavobacterium sp. NRK F10]MCO6174068.1 DUF2202 domain-containing protein [Flavobacterium sp. NRK F10]
MRTTLLKTGFILLVLVLSGCSDNDDNNNYEPLTATEQNSLLFMLEEEKLARDTYRYLDDLWSLTEFENIKQSEQSHMDAIAQQLDRYNISYTILPEGQFNNQNLQDLYDQFVIDGQANQVAALTIGATIEDLDIVDLQEESLLINNSAVLNVYESLQCGSRNHLRSFVSALDNLGETYTPQYLTQEEYNTIITSPHEQCN